MTDSCRFCGTDAISLDDWFLKIRFGHGKIGVIECICPWCVRDIEKNKSLMQTLEKAQ